VKVKLFLTQKKSPLSLALTFDGFIKNALVASFGKRYHLKIEMSAARNIPFVRLGLKNPAAVATGIAHQHF